jgi:hypothetical protein
MKIKTHVPKKGSTVTVDVAVVVTEFLLNANDTKIKSYIFCFFNSITYKF